MLGRVCANSYMADNSASLHVTPVLRHMLKKFADIVVFIRQSVILSHFPGAHFFASNGMVNQINMDRLKRTITTLKNIGSAFYHHIVSLGYKK